MITVEYDKTTCAVSVHGHAGSAEPGCDLVCAACSMLVYGLLQALTDLCPRSAPGKGGIRRCRAEPGDAHIEWHAEEWEKARAMLIFAAYASGFRALARENPDYVQYTEK